MGGAVSFDVLLVEIFVCCFVLFFCRGNLSGPRFVAEVVQAKDS
jgi:hypothetical protein